MFADAHPDAYPLDANSNPNTYSLSYPDDADPHPHCDANGYAVLGTTNPGRGCHRSAGCIYRVPTA